MSNVQRASFVATLVLTSLLLLPTMLQAQEAEAGINSETISQKSTHMGEMTMTADDAVGVDDSLRFEPYQSIEDMFLRDDVVFLMRHGPTDWSKIDAYEVAPNDCDNQRIISDQGRKDMQNLGALMARNEILPSRIVVSEWCRNQQTLSELLSGVARVDPQSAEEIPFETSPDLNLLLSLQGAPNVADLRNLISSWEGDPDRKGPLLVISHYTNIEELTQFRLFEGEILVLDPKRDNRVLGYLRLSSSGPDEGHFSDLLSSPLVSDEQVLDMVSRYYDALHTNDLDMLSEVIADQWVNQGVSADEAGIDRDAFLSNLAEFRSALDDATFEIQNLYVVDGVVTVIGKIEGHHQSNLACGCKRPQPSLSP